MEDKETELTEQEEVSQNSTTAENLRAWKELLSSSEAKEFVSSILERSAVLFGQTHPQKIIQTVTNIALMVTAFACIGTLAYFKLLSDGTAGVLAGIIIGYFFKKDD